MCLDDMDLFVALGRHDLTTSNNSMIVRVNACNTISIMDRLHLSLIQGCVFFISFNCRFGICCFANSKIMSTNVGPCHRHSREAVYAMARPQITAESIPISKCVVPDFAHNHQRTREGRRDPSKNSCMICEFGQHLHNDSGR